MAILAAYLETKPSANYGTGGNDIIMNTYNNNSDPTSAAKVQNIIDSSKIRGSVPTTAPDSLYIVTKLR
jgi:hypothetical protein